MRPRDRRRCFVARVHVRSIEDLERLIDQIIPHAMTTTLDHPVDAGQTATAAHWLEHLAGAPRTRSLVKEEL